MELVNIVIFILMGAIAGWLAGNLMRGGGFGLLWNIILGIVGAFIGAGCLACWEYTYLVGGSTRW